MRISQQEFAEIIQQVAADSPGCDGVEINGLIVTMRWHSSRGNQYTQKYDFNDQGEVTGRMLCLSPAPYPGSTAPGIFENKAYRAIKQSLDNR